MKICWKSAFRFFQNFETLRFFGCTKNCNFGMFALGQGGVRGDLTAFKVLIIKTWEFLFCFFARNHPCARKVEQGLVDGLWSSWYIMMHHDDSWPWWMVMQNHALFPVFRGHESLMMIIMMMHDDAWWIKMQENGLLNFSCMGEGVARSWSSKSKSKIVPFGVQIYEPTT